MAVYKHLKGRLRERFGPWVTEGKKGKTTLLGPNDSGEDAAERRGFPSLSKLYPSHLLEILQTHIVRHDL